MAAKSISGGWPVLSLMISKSEGLSYAPGEGLTATAIGY